MSILSRALLKQLAEKRVAQLAYDAVTANVLDTPQRTKDAMVDIMSNTEQHVEIRSFVEEALKKEDSKSNSWRLYRKRSHKSYGHAHIGVQ